MIVAGQSRHKSRQRARDATLGRRTGVQIAGAAGLLCLAISAQAQAQAQVASGRSTSASASVDTALIYSDVQRPQSPTTGRDLAVSVRPAVQFASRAGRIRGSLSYSLELIRHTRDTDPSEARNTLNAAFVTELIEGRAFVDTQATISQGSISAFGTQSTAASVTDNTNRTEVGTVSIAPYVKGAMGSVATYEVRLYANGTNTRRSTAGDSVTTGGSLALNSASSNAMIGWGLQASQQTVDFRAGQTAHTDRMVATLSFRPDPEISLALRAGREGNDVTSDGRTASTTSGGTLRWTPTERTVAELSADKRYFGRSHRLTLSHRLARSSFIFTSTRDTTNSSDPTGVGRPVTLYQVLFNQFASLAPDPVQREQFVLDFIRITGQDPNTVVAGGFLNAAVSLQQRQDLSWNYTGLRTTLTVQAFTSSSTVLTLANQQAAQEPVRQSGYNVSTSYRLTPTASLSLTGSRLAAFATRTQPGTTLKSVSLSWTDQLGRRTSTSAGLRYSTFNSALDPYRELAATVSFSLRF